MKMRGLLVIVNGLIWASLLMMTPGCDGSRDHAGEPILKVRLGYNVQSLNYAPVMVANDGGFFNIAGLEIELIAVKSGKEVRQGLASGHIDIGFSSPTDIFMVVNAGAPVKIVAPLTVTTTHLFVRPENRKMSFQEMAGKRVRGGRGGQSEFVFRWALKREAVDASQVEFVHVDNMFRWVALMEKEVVDVVPLSFYGVPDLEDHGAVFHEGWVEAGYSNEYWLNKVMSVNSDFLEENEKAVGEILGAILEAQKFIHTNRNESAGMVGLHIKRGSQGVKNFTPDDVLSMWNGGVRYVLWYEPGIIQEMAGFQYEAGILDKELSLSEIYDSRFSEVLKSAHMELYESKN